MSHTAWMLYGVLLMFQNFSFTFVSRARNSGSLSRHLIASVLSASIWFNSQLIMVNDMMGDIKGSNGIGKQVFATVFYTVCTVAGSLVAHYWALRTEKGSASVGASKRYVQITVEEWEQIKEKVSRYEYEVVGSGGGVRCGSNSVG